MPMNYLYNLFKKSNYGLVINWEFHKRNKWASALSPYLVNAIIKKFNPIIITSQFEYSFYKNRLKYIISLEPGWAAPKITYDKHLNHIVGVFVSDPHNKIDWFQKYIEENKINYVFSYYNYPFFYHFPDFPKEKFFHFPWAIPDQFISTNKLFVRNSEISIFGGKNSNAYDTRNWCRDQEGITCFDNSGVENKKMKDSEYFLWLTNFDAIIAAGSSNPIYDLVTPKYFEIAAAGALVIGQYCNDLKILGFNEKNSIIFDKENFKEKIQHFRDNPEYYIHVRENGRDLIKQKHKISDRIQQMENVFLSNLES